MQDRKQYGVKSLFQCLATLLVYCFAADRCMADTSIQVFVGTFAVHILCYLPMALLDTLALVRFLMVPKVKALAVAVVSNIAGIVVGIPISIVLNFAFGGIVSLLLWIVTAAGYQFAYAESLEFQNFLWATTEYKLGVFRDGQVTDTAGNASFLIVVFAALFYQFVASTIVELIILRRSGIAELTIGPTGPIVKTVSISNGVGMLLAFSCVLSRHF